MTGYLASRFGRYTLALAITAVIIVGSVWVKGKPQAGIDANGPQIDVSALMSSMDIGKLPVLYIAEPF
jgi:hypothetical protein